MPTLDDIKTRTVEEQLLHDIFSQESSNDEDVYRHYFHKKDLDAQLMNPGLTIYAFCGFKKDGLANPAAGGDICPKCIEKYNNLPPTE